MNMKRLGMLLLAFLVLCLNSVGALADEGIEMPVYVVDGLPATAIVYPVHFASNGPVLSDEDLAAVTNAAWSGDIPAGAQKQSYPARREDGGVRMPFVSFMGESGMSGSFKYTFLKNGEAYAPITYTMHDSHLTYNRKMENVPGLRLNRETGNFDLYVKPGDTVKLENFLLPEENWDYSYEWNLLGSEGFVDLTENEPAVYTIKATDNQKAIQFMALHKSPAGEVIHYSMIFNLEFANEPVDNGSAGSPAIPETGDGAHIMLWLALVCIGICGAVILSRNKREA